MFRARRSGKLPTSSQAMAIRQMTLVCWKCGAALDTVPLPISRYARCPACEADLYVCRLCVHYDPRCSRACREERAEPPREADHANFCDWFEPRPNAHTDISGREHGARAALEGLFGGPDDGVDTCGDNPLDDLFKN